MEKKSGLKAVYLPQTSERVFPLSVFRGKVSENACKQSLNVVNYERLWFTRKIWSSHNAPKNTEQYGGKLLSHSFDSDQKALWKYFSNITKPIWEFTWEKGAVLAATENTEAKERNLLVIALRNHSLVVMKAAFSFLNKKADEESSTHC